MRNVTLSALTFILAVSAPMAGAGAAGPKLALAVDKTEYLVGEPFVVTARLANEEDDLMVLRGSFSFAKYLHLYCRPERAGEWMIYTASLLANEEVGTPVVRAEQSATAVRLFAGWEFFAQPGRVDLQLRYHPQGGPEVLSSEVVSVRIVAPSSRDAEAARRWLDEDIQEAVQFPEIGSVAAKAAAKLAGIIAEFPDSVYADFARAALQRSAATGAENADGSGEPTRSINAVTPAAAGDTITPQANGQAQDRGWKYAAAGGILFAVAALALWFRLRRK